LLNADVADPLTAEQIDALFQPLLDAKTLLIAVSGGPDSTALLVMAAEWAARCGARIAAATVDHGLRPESATEAETVATLSAKLGVPHKTLVWTGAKPSTRVQERAREARYRLLIGHARAIGADAIATAHHADDQAETVLFRLVRGSGVAGLSGIEAMSQRNGVTIARPLLGVAKRDLVAFCRLRGAAFADDPSNANPRFARPRLRALLDRLGEEGLNAEGLVRLARRAAEADEALEQMTADLEAKLGAEGPIDAKPLFAEPIAIVQRTLARRIGKVGGRDESRIGLEKIEALALRLRDALANQRALNANVGGALVRLSAKGRLSFAPEPARRRTPVMAVPGLDLGIDPAIHAGERVQPSKNGPDRPAANPKRVKTRGCVHGRANPRIKSGDGQFD
jgi:tRNA(Ile)-lysidine synthase